MSDALIRLAEFKTFYKCLMQNAPTGFIPWFFPLGKDSKVPADDVIRRRSPMNCVDKASWKAKHARLTFGEGLRLIEKGYNIGISARENDCLVLIDMDYITGENDLKPSLIVRSRSRIGGHGYFFSVDTRLKRNITTDKNGEIRSCDQYLVAPGSYVPTSEEEICAKCISGQLTDMQANDIIKDTLLGYYSVLIPISPVDIVFEEIPQVFKDKLEADRKAEEERKIKSVSVNKHNKSHKESGLYSLRLSDFVSVTDKRDRHPLHDSETGQNFSIDKSGLGHCWRHLVSLNAFQYLVVKSGYMSCDYAGSGHKGSHTSGVIGDDGAHFFAWKQAKDDGLIPIDDPIPTAAMRYIANKHGLYSGDGLLPRQIYNQVIEIVKKEY
jgi:hypothetical protein